jgi:hypothetical protein
MRLIYLCLIALAISGCEKELQFDNPEFQPKLVVNGFVSTDSIANIGISRSTSTLSQPSKMLLAGKVKVLVLKDKLLLYSDSLALQNSMLEIPFKPIMGSHYELQVSHNDLPTIRATDTVPLSKPSVTISALTDEGTSYRLVLKIRDQMEINRYAINLNFRGKEQQGADSISKGYPITFTSSDKIFLSSIKTIATGSQLAIFNDETWNGTERSIELIFDKSLIQYPDFTPELVVLDVKVISKAMYDYYIEVNNNTHVYGGPLASVSRVVGNIDNGLGAFCFYTESVTQLQLP